MLSYVLMMIMLTDIAKAKPVIITINAKFWKPEKNSTFFYRAYFRSFPFHNCTSGLLYHFYSDKQRVLAASANFRIAVDSRDFIRSRLIPVLLYTSS